MAVEVVQFNDVAFLHLGHTLDSEVSRDYVNAICCRNDETRYIDAEMRISFVGYISDQRNSSLERGLGSRS